MKTLLVCCHPDHESFTAAAQRAVLEGLRIGNHECREVDLYAEGFDPVWSAAEHLHHGLDDTIVRHADNLRWCESLVLVYPTWWAGQPAMLKGWMDRVWVEGVAFHRKPGGHVLRPSLRNIRRITVVTTHGSTKFVNALEGEAGKRIAFRSLRAMCSARCRTKWFALYNIDRATPAQREAFLARVTAQLR